MIVGFKGQPLGTIDELHKRLIAAEIGVPSALMVLRGTEKLFLLVTPRELPAESAATSPAPRKQT